MWVHKIVFFLKGIITFFQQGCTKYIKSDSINIYNVTKDLYFKEMLLFWTLLLLLFLRILYK